MKVMFYDRMANFEADLLRSPSTSPRTVFADCAKFQLFIVDDLGSHRKMELLARTVDSLEMQS